MILEGIIGTLTGLLGTAITSVMNYKTQKMANEHEIAKIKAETDAMKIEAEMQIQVTKAKIEGEIEVADAQAYTESQKQGNEKMFSDEWIAKLFAVEGKVMRFIAVPAAIFLALAFGFIDWLRGVMRPGLTIYLTFLSTAITYMAWDILKQYGLSIPLESAVEIYDKVISIIIYLTVSCVTWWFGDRRIAKFLTSMNGGKK